MSHITDLLRMVFISLEFAWLCIALAVFFLFNDLPLFLGEQLKGDSEMWKALYSLPIALMGLALRFSAKLRAPMGKDENKALYEWPHYHRLKSRAVFGFFLCLSCAVGSIIIWVMSEEINASLLATLYLIFVGMSGFSLLSLVLAEQRLKEILTSLT